MPRDVIYDRGERYIHIESYGLDGGRLDPDMLEIDLTTDLQAKYGRVNVHFVRDRFGGNVLHFYLRENYLSESTRRNYL